MAEPARVFVIGSFVVACSVRVERLPAPGESLRADGFLLEPGGKGFNVAVASKRLGLAVDGLFATGADLSGELARRAFRDHGLDAGMILTLSGATGGGVGLVEASGDARIAVHPGANDALTADLVEATADRIFASQGLYAQFEAPDAAIVKSFEIARMGKVRTILNPSPIRAIPVGLLRLTDILIMNLAEARHLMSQTGFEGESVAADWLGPNCPLARWCADQGVGATVVTLGAAGARVWRNGEHMIQPAFAVEATDGTGAGDAFAAALLRSRLSGEGGASSLRTACAAGAFVAARWGVLDALPTMEALDPILAGESPA